MTFFIFLLHVKRCDLCVYKADPLCPTGRRLLSDALGLSLTAPPLGEKERPHVHA